MSELPGIRVLFKVDWRAILPPFFLVLWLVMLLEIILWVRPDLLYPAQIGTDSSNYYAAGQRLNAGHELYQLQAGDRPVANGLDPTPWSYPLLSPPPITVLWRGLALIPGDLSMYLWAYAGAALFFAFVALLIVRSPPRFYLGLLALMPFIAVTAWSGNVNAYLIPACALVWWASVKGRPALAGSLVGIAFILKLMPGMLIWWLIVRRDTRAVAACLVTAAVALVVSVIGAGPDSFVQYVAVARQAGSVALPPLSPASLAALLGVPKALADLVPYLLAAGAAALAWRWRDRPSWAFAACGAGVALGTPDLRIEALGWLLLAVVPFANDPAPRFWQRRPAPIRSDQPA